MAKKGSRLPDRKHAPKRTGKSNLTLANHREKGEQEFTGTLAKQDEQRDAKEKAAGDETKVVEQGSSLLIEQPPKPKVVGEMFESYFLTAVFVKTAKGKKLISYKLTAPLEKEHLPILPKEFANGLKATMKPHVAGQRLKDVPAMNVIFYSAHDQPEPMVVLEHAQIIGAHIDVIQRKGEGESRKVHRLSFNAQVERSRRVLHFAENNDKGNFWIKLEPAQLKLAGINDEPEEEDEE
jgi:hypothetical protein